MIRPIDCELHDHLEVACLYRYEMTVTLTTGDIIQGRAITTITQPDRTEMLVLHTREGDQSIAMHQLHRVEIETKGAKFRTLEFPHSPNGEPP